MRRSFNVDSEIMMSEKESVVSKGNRRSFGGRISDRVDDVVEKSPYGILFTISFVLVVCGIVWFCIQGFNRFTGVDGHLSPVYLKVAGSIGQTDTLETDDATVTMDTYHLTSSYKGQSVVLDENYIDEELADSMTGQHRFVMMNKDSLKVAHDKGITFFFAIPLIIGFIMFIMTGVKYIRH